MTFYEYCIEYLRKNRMWEKQASAVMGRVVSATENSSLVELWDSDIDGDPLETRAALMAMLNRYALEWIDENLPPAWFRPMFEVQS